MDGEISEQDVKSVGKGLGGLGLLMSTYDSDDSDGKTMDEPPKAKAMKIEISKQPTGEK